MTSRPVLETATEALIAQLVAGSFDYFANGTSSPDWDPSLGPSQIGRSYHDYEDPLSSYERDLLEGTDQNDFSEGWTIQDVRSNML